MFKRSLQLISYAVLVMALSGPALVAADDIATTDGETPGVRVKVTELKRTSGDTVTLKFTLVNDSDKKLDMGGSFLGDKSYGYDYRTVSGVHLIDAAGKKKYLPVRDTAHKCVCSVDLKDVDAKASITLWAKFPAPPADVQKVSVVIPHFIPLDEVPISQ